MIAKLVRSLVCVGSPIMLILALVHHTFGNVDHGIFYAVIAVIFELWSRDPRPCTHVDFGRSHDS